MARCSLLIEPEQYQAIVQQREADLAKAEAEWQNARAQLNRGQELLKQKNIAQAKVDELQAAAPSPRRWHSARPRRP